MKNIFMLVIVILLSGCASTQEPEVKYFYVEKVSVAQASVTSSSDERTTRGGSSYFVTRMRVAQEGASVVSAGNCGGLTVNNYTEASVVEGKVLYHVHQKCRTGNHEADGYCLKDQVSHKVDKDYPYGGLVEKQGLCKNDWTLPFCSQEPGRTAGEWQCLSELLIALGEKEIGKARQATEKK